MSRYGWPDRGIASGKTSDPALRGAGHCGGRCRSGRTGRGGRRQPGAGRIAERFGADMLLADGGLDRPACALTCSPIRPSGRRWKRSPTRLSAC